MKKVFIKGAAFAELVIVAMSLKVTAQNYVSPTAPAQTGKSPGVKIKLLSTNGQTSNYVLIFSAGDEVKSGLTEFAQKYRVKSAHFTGIGDAQSARVGFFDYNRKMFKVIPIDEPCEITSLIGNIALMDGKPVVHVHINVADSAGASHGGHLLEMIVGPTLEVFVTVEPVPLNKKVDPQYGAGVIDPFLEH
jgi:predicted DNA-binding protein with PD1-like motif